MIDTGLRDKVVVVTGANNPHGIGAAVARAFVMQKAKVFLHYHLGIAVNAVSLGPVQTGWITPELEREILPTIPLDKVGNPEDVVDVIVFLASDQARWVTGQIIYVGGGHRM